MADLTITAANVVAATGANIIHRTAGATITAGQCVYMSSTTDRAMLADNNSATAEARTPVGIALHAASSGQPLAIATSGDITIGATVTAGVVYYLSDTAGGIIPVADLGSGEYPCTIGIATSASVIRLGIQASGVAL
jgi:hypothetical protein